MDKPVSEVWKHFKKAKNKDEAQCTLCPKLLSCKGSSTSGLARHLEKVHKINISKAGAEVSQTQNIVDLTSRASDTDVILLPQSVEMPKRSRIETYFKRPEKMSELVSQLAAKDGISIRAITRSDFIRESFKLRQMTLPKSEQQVMQLVIEFYNEKRCEMVNELESLLKSDHRFSTTLDEWTSLKNRRYLNINLHGDEGQMYNLGLVYISGKCGATEIQEIVEKRLSEFNLNFRKHIVTSTTDGASVMKKFGRQSPSEMMLCINHAIHLAVQDVLYTKITRETTTELASDDTRSEYSDVVIDNDIDGNEDHFSGSEDELEQEVDVSIRPDIQVAIEYIRRIARIFRKSPLKNGILQAYVKQEHSHELQLCLDVKTRWNSLVVMVQRFLILKNSIKKALIDISESWVEEYVPIWENLYNMLNPVKLAVEALSRQDTTLISCDAIVTVLLKKIRNMRTPLSEELCAALQMRIEERRDVRLFSLCAYLHNPDSLAFSDLPTAPKKIIITYGEQLTNRLFPRTQYSKSTSSDEDVSLQRLQETPFEIELNEAILNANKTFSADPISDGGIKLKKEFDLYATTKKRTPNLNLLYKALLTVKPTSTDSERVFSIAGSFVTKTRNRLSDQSLNALAFLKAYYNKGEVNK